MDTRDLLADAFSRVQTEVERAASGLSADGLAYRPDDEANSIAWLVWHLTRVQDDHVSELAGRRQAYSSDGWAQRLGREPDDADTGFGHTPDQVAAVTPASADVLLAYHHAVLERSLAYLRTVTAEELDRLVDFSWEPPVSAGVRLVSVISDCLQHAGQANYVRGLFERRAGG